ncbi:MAG: M23 family metallopeptidase [Deltaproteobacteria bacterium]|nr:M23 family metallopeptidase [Deltaproteobacteria bacterium]
MGGYDPGPGFREGSPFNQRRGDRYHKGVDFPAEQGTPIPCAADGVIVGRGWNDDFGNIAILLHDDPLSAHDKYTLYAHMPNLDAVPVIGTEVARGEIIGTVGNTGFSFGAHLHFELLSLEPGSWWSVVDPYTGGPTGIAGSQGRLDPLNGSNWGGLDVYDGSSTSESAATGS